MSAILGNKNRSITVTGTTNEYFTSGGWQIARGRFFNDGELRSGGAVCPIGETVRKELFGMADVVGERLRLRAVSCEVIGLLQLKGKNPFGMDRDDVVIMPVRTFQRRLSGSDDINQIQLSVRDSASTEKAQQDISSFMRERRRLAEGDNDDFRIMDQKELASTLSGTTRTLTALLAAIAAVSLLVGGIGIMNIMLVSVTERTREIGIRLAIRALERDVLTQFLVEAVVLSAFGGVIGVSFALIVSSLGARTLGLPWVLDVKIVLLALLFSAGVGVVFGFFPARRAASLNPIDALRHE
jgi:putative ABC transport system permease protein